jgi:hypothetical protein
MIGGSRIPLEQWPTSKLLAVGLVIFAVATSGLGLTLRGAWRAWNQGEITVCIGALAVAVFFGFWLVIFGQFGKILLRRARGNHPDPSTPPAKGIAAAEAKEKAESKQPYPRTAKNSCSSLH